MSMLYVMRRYQSTERGSQKRTHIELLLEPPGKRPYSYVEVSKDRASGVLGKSLVLHGVLLGQNQCQDVSLLLVEMISTWITGAHRASSLLCESCEIQVAGALQTCADILCRYWLGWLFFQVMWLSQVEETIPVSAGYQGKDLQNTDSRVVQSF